MPHHLAYLAGLLSHFYLPQLICPPEIHRRRGVWSTSFTEGRGQMNLGVGDLKRVKESKIHIPGVLSELPTL